MSRSLRALARGGVFALLFLAACGGGGGDGGGGGPSGPVTLSNSYLFRIADTASHPPFAVAFTDSTGDHKVVISHQNLPGATAVTGTLATNTHEWTFDAGSEWQVDTNQGAAPLLGGFVLGFDTTVVVPPDGPPTAGSLSVDAGSFEALLTFVASGISMSVDGGAAVLYTWSEFEDLMEDPTATPQEQIAAFGVQVVRFMIERYDHVLDLIFQLVDVSDLEEGYNPRTTQGVPWPSGYTMVPATTDNPGFGSLGWNDRDLSDGVNGGDDLSWGLWDCRPYSDVDWMYDGATTFQNLVESVDGSNTVQSVGFAPSGGREGGVFHDGMHIEEMEVDDGAMTVSVDSILMLSGAFTFVLTAP